MPRSTIAVANAQVPDRHLETDAVTVPSVDGTTTVHREVVRIAGAGVDDWADVATAAPADGARGLVVRLAGLAGLALDATLTAVRDRLPAALGGNGGLRAELVAALPPGGNTIGAVDVGDRAAREVGRVRDRYTGGEALADQAGGAVRTFTFASAVQLVWVRVDGDSGRADPFGGTPADGVGIYCESGIPNPITVQCTTVRVWAPTGSTIRVWGFRE